MRLPRFALVATLFSITAACSTAPDDRTRVVTDATLVLVGRVIDGSGAAPIENGRVVLSGERIACVGVANDCVTAADVALIAVDDSTILPGLVDLHVHARPHYLPWFISAGVTTIRDANNSLAMVEKNLGVEKRPRIFWTGPMLDGPNTVMRHFGEEGVLRPAAADVENAWTLEVTSPTEACEAVDLLAARGAAFVKLYEQLPPDVYRAAAHCAAKRGLHVMTDLGMHNTRGLSGAEVDALQAMTAGIRSIEHSSGFALAYERLLATATVKSDTALVPTLSVSYSFSDDVVNVEGLPMADRLPEEMHAFFEHGANSRTGSGREKSHLAYRMSEAILKRVHELGGTIGAGSDTPAGVYNIPGGGIHRELELLVKAGLTPMAAIHAATGAAGEILGRPELGRLRAGAFADVLVVAGKPDQDIRHTRNIRVVILNGKQVDIEAGEADLLR